MPTTIATCTEYSISKDDEQIFVREEYLDYLNLTRHAHLKTEEQRKILSLALHQELEPFEFYSKVMRWKDLNLISADINSDELDRTPFVSNVEVALPLFKAEIAKLENVWAKLL
jgi:hypothetical protein